MLKVNDLNQYRFYKLNVSSGTQWTETTIDKLVDSVVALHAARIGKPYISLINKGITDSVQTMFKHMNFSNKFAYVRCMRKTLHLCNASDFELLHYATRNIRISKKLKNQEEKYIRKSGDLIEDFIDNGSRLPEELYSLLTNKLYIEKAFAQQLVKFHWENGLITLNNESPVFYHEKRTFQLTRVKFGIELNTNFDEQFYINELIKRYIFCYGPVSFDDIVWWSGLPKTKVIQALKDCENCIIEFDINQLPFSLYIFLEQWYELNDFISPNCWCKFMGFEDCVMKGYKQTRFFYSENYQRFFNSIGEIFPTIVLNGQCIGTWDVDLKRKRLDVKICESISLNKWLLEKELINIQTKIWGE